MDADHLFVAQPANVVRRFASAMPMEAIKHDADRRMSHAICQVERSTQVMNERVLIPCRTITRYRDPASNLRTQFLRILDAAGVAPWPKLFQNLRSTRQTELTEEFPAHVVCAWLGTPRRSHRAITSR
ncbi:MAG: hypothetical protein WBD40_02105 [Tepidisphaeraceae bacterium]